MAVPLPEAPPPISINLATAPRHSAPDVGKRQLLRFSRDGCPQFGRRVGEFRYGLGAHGLLVCSQSCQGSTLHPQCGANVAGPVMIPSASFAVAFPVSVACSLGPPVAAIQRMNAVRSATSLTSYRRPSGLPAPLQRPFRRTAPSNLFSSGELSMLAGHRDHWRTVGDHQQNQRAISAYLKRDENGQS